MSRRSMEASSDSDSDEDGTNFKRRKISSSESRNGSRDVIKAKSVLQEPLPNFTASCHLKQLPSPNWTAKRTYFDRDNPEDNPCPVVVPSRPERGRNGTNTDYNANGNGVIPHPHEHLSAREISNFMGFGKGKGLANYLAEVDTLTGPKFSIEEFDDKVNVLGICLADMELQSVDDVSVKESIKWIISDDKPTLTFDMLVKGRKVGTQVTSIEIDPDNAFIDPHLYDELIECKKLFQNLSKNDYQIVRSKGNLFEKLNKGPFLCRAAMKIANLDVVLNHELTQPVTRAGHRVLSMRDLFYFADVCGGPGGFTEYILWKKKWEAKGFGLTLKGEVDFDITNFLVETETFQTFYGEANDGNIYNPVNVSSFIQHVIANTGKKGVHLMMADGGFSVTQRENMQEVLCHQIILSQIYVALAIVRVGGHAVCKLFDVVTPFTAALIYLMYYCFESVTIHKPLASRPANSERYLICKWKKSEKVTSHITSYLGDCHQKMWMYMNGGNKEAILELVPVTLLASVLDPFYIYLRDCNNRIARSQIVTLKRMVAFVKDRTLNNNEMQEEARIKAIKHWGIPKELPAPAMFKTPDNGCKAVMQELPLTMLRRPEKDLAPENIELLFKSAYDWRFVPTTGFKKVSNRGFYLSLGQGSLYRYHESQWVSVPQFAQKLLMPSNTLVYGEFGNEIYGNSGAEQTVIPVFHIIDALMLGGMDLRNVHCTQRQEMSVKFAEAHTMPGTLQIRAKALIRMEHLAMFIQKLQYRLVKGAGNGARVVCPLDMTNPDSPFIIPSGLLFLKITKVSGVSNDHIPGDAISGFFHTMGNRVLWTWDSETNVTVTKLDADDPRINYFSQTRVHTCNLVSFINYMIRQRPSVTPPKTTLYIGAQKSTKQDGAETPTSSGLKNM
ncbi:cap-specific mRNA (nucleoside-2'-O-)-methyltransferase 1 isoform X2 [Folsomia candida]|uniref:cap-specific mRNA (nucleoside-2'-O-)-methyltransferase 1 isoform X2 n=1 Tax=Folsomia candida TaxID=158441 RepID=UPI000B8FAC11|nr:cap-specific mRNA (nucleoside-2'-O-)-methyltransferase 1 isoform X2 [Folsomia candida]